jgi:cyanophycinase
VVGSAGPVALVGSGEFLEVMVPVDAALLAGRPARVAILPTAAGLESDERVAWWIDLARRHYEAMGVEPVPVPVRRRADAEDGDLAALIEGVGLVYLSGGDPHHLASTLRGSPVWEAIVRAWQGGAAVAGCSAGAMALTSGAPPDLGPGGTHRSVPGAGSPGATTQSDDGAGLGLVGHLAVIPHFDLLERRRPGIVQRFSSWQPPATTLVGVEEETALVSTGPGWRVHGAGAVWVFGSGEPARFVAGQDVDLPPPAP